MRFRFTGFFLLIMALARGATYLGDQTFSAPFGSTDAIKVAGNVTFSNPGAYEAQLWQITGEVRFGAPGDYVISGTSNSIAIGGAFRGPANGTAAVTLRYMFSLALLGGMTGPNVTVAYRQIPLGGSVNPNFGEPPTTSEPGLQLPAPGAAPAPLLNISVRVSLGAGQSVSPGFVIGGTTRRRVLIRAV